jgi:cation diffusion facilitator CzcD-associated flavoprotein CzcO
VADEVNLEEVRLRYATERAKRVDPRRDHTLDLTDDLARYRRDPHTEVLKREPVDDRVDAVVVGGGFGGLLVAAQLRKAGLEAVRVIDQAGDFGGVWYWNRYPGAQCDIESHIYLPLLEELDYVPTERYAHAPEIHAHAQAIGRHFDLYEHALFHTSVTRSAWSEVDQQWIVETDRGDRVSATFFVVAIGSLDKLKVPAIPGVETFAGHSFHTSRWDYEYTGGPGARGLGALADKRVGIIGTGATALQVIPHLAQAAKELFVFQRTPSTVGIRANRPTGPEWDGHREPGWQRERMRNFTEIIMGVETEVDLVDDGWTHLYRELIHPSPDVVEGVDPDRRGEVADLHMMDKIRDRIRQEVADPSVAASLMPQYRYLCKRPGFHDEYLAAFNEPAVTLVDTAGQGIDEIRPEGPVVAGELVPLDCLVWATGFEWNTSYSSRIGFDVLGREGVSLAEKWRDGPRTLHGILTHGFPNFFTLPGPNSQAVVTTNFMHLLTEVTEHIGAMVAQLRSQGAVVIEATADGEDAWVQTVLSRATVNHEFQSQCTPGRFNNEGAPDERSRLNVNFGGGPLEFFDLLRKWRSEPRLDGVTIDHAHDPAWSVLR